MEAQTHENFSRAEPADKPSSDRSFGVVFTVVFTVLGTMPLLRGKPARLWCLGISAAFLVLTLTVPAMLGPLNRLWMRIGVLIGKVTNPIIASLMFFVVFTPVALLCRLLGKDLLRLKMDAGAKTYWMIRHPPGPSPETMRNQF